MKSADLIFPLWGRSAAGAEGASDSVEAPYPPQTCFSRRSRPQPIR